MKYLLFSFIFFIASFYCFAQDDDKNEKVVIEYNLNNQDSAFKIKFPFDEPFTVRVINIPPAVNSLKFAIYKYSSDASQPAVLVQQVTPTEWKRNSADEKSTNFNIPKLKPNADYRFELGIGAERALTAAEITTVKAKLLTDISLQNSINTVAKGYIDKFFKDHLVSYNPLADHTNEIVKNIENSIATTDPILKISEIDPVKALDEISTFTDKLHDIADKIEQIDLLQKNQPNANKNAIVKATNDFKQRFKAINWATLTSNLADNDYTDFKNALDKIKTSYNPPPQGADLAAISAIETSIDDAIAAREALKTAIVDKVILPYLYYFTGINATYRADFVKQSKLYITLDVGLAYAFRIDRAIAYSGVNIYFRPINKAIPLSHFSGWDWWAVRTSLLIGITLQSIEKDNIRKGLIGDNALVLGAGFRVVPFLKFNAGAFVHYRYDKNPLLTSNRYYISFSPFISFSLDIDVKTLFSGVGNSIFK